MLRIIFGAFLALHGLVHVIGFLGPFHIGQIRTLPESSLLWGSIGVTEGGAKVFGVLWLVATAAFLLAAMGVWLEAPWTVPMTTAAAILSATLCLLQTPEAIAGLVIDLLLLVALLGMPGRLVGL